MPSIPHHPGSGSTTEEAPTGVEAALASVPIAQDGMVIDANFHNSLRAALIVLADSVSEGTLDESSRLTLAPAFERVPGEKASWRVTPEAAEGVDGSTGWLPLNVVHGARLQTLAVSHTADATMAKLEISLERTSVEDSSTTRLFQLERGRGDGTPRIDTASLEVKGVKSPAAQEEFRRVDNSTYRYFIRASTTGHGQAIDGATDSERAHHVSVHALQVFFTR